MIEGIIFAFFVGVGITAAFYEVKYELNERKACRLASKTWVDVLEGSSMRINERQKILKRELTEAEKDKVVDEYYTEYKENRIGVI